MKKIIFIVSIYILSALFFSSCGSSDEMLDDSDEIILTPITSSDKADAKETEGEYSADALQPTSLTYLGAFLLPNDGESEEEMFSYGGEAMCYNPANDSLFITGHNWFAYVAEISIPEPVVSKDISQLPSSHVVTDLTDMKGNLFNKWTMEIPRVGLEVIGDKLFFCFGEHMEEDTQLGTHGYTDLNLSEAKKVCVIGDYLYSTNDYLFAIPETFINDFGGNDLLTGRFRDGGWSGMGPSLFALSSQDIIDADNNERIAAVPVIKYDDSFNGDEGYTVNDYSHADSWTGGAFISCDAGDAIIFAGTHSCGDTWYGFSNGVVYPADGDENEKYPDVPDYPNDQRGWWSDDFRAFMMFYDIGESIKVINEEVEPYEIQPYAFLDLSEYMLVERDETDMQYLGAVAYDASGNRLYVLELFADEARSVVHVFTFE